MVDANRHRVSPGQRSALSSCCDRSRSFTSPGHRSPGDHRHRRPRWPFPPGTATRRALITGSNTSTRSRLPACVADAMTTRRRPGGLEPRAHINNVAETRKASRPTSGHIVIRRRTHRPMIGRRTISNGSTWWPGTSAPRLVDDLPPRHVYRSHRREARSLRAIPSGRRPPP